MAGGDEEPVLARLEPVTWSPEDGIAYEVALEGINQVVGAYSGLIGREEASENPDTAAIESWSAAQGEWVHRRETISPGDRAGVDRVRAECSALLRELRGRR
jgi:hypothetical protein